MTLSTWYEVCVVRGGKHVDNTATGTLDSARSAVRRFDALYDGVLIVVRQHLRGTRRFRVLRSLTLDKRAEGRIRYNMLYAEGHDAGASGASARAGSVHRDAAPIGDGREGKNMNTTWVEYKGTPNHWCYVDETDGRILYEIVEEGPGGHRGYTAFRETVDPSVRIGRFRTLGMAKQGVERDALQEYETGWKLLAREQQGK